MFNYFINLSLLVLVNSFAFAQTNQNAEDLDFLYSKITKLPSYKDQFDKEKRERLRLKVDSLKSVSGNDSDSEFF
jgi:hypothetical protein